MSHALTESQAATWRLHPQRVRGYLTVWEPELVCKFVCDLPTVSYPCRQLGIDSVLEGDVEDVEVGMLFRIFDATGATLKGTGRAKQISGDTLIIHPVGQGDIDFTDGDVVEVYDFYLPYALLPYISPDGTLYKDYTLAFDDQTGEHFPPVANATVDRHADLVDSSGVITVTFDASTSFAMTDGGSISSYAWDFKDGTVVSGSTSTPQATVSFPAGRRWVSLVVTDDASNASNPKRIPIFAANPDTHRPHRARLARLGYSLQAGWEASFDLLDADTSGIPDHALVIFWLDRYYGGLRGDLTGCSTQFIGWTTSELIGLEPLWWSTHTLNVQGPIAILAGRPAFPQTVRSDVTPETWAEVKTLNWWKTVIYLLMWHSNILDLCNLVRPEWYNLYPVPRLDTEAGTLYDQVVFLAHAIFGEFTADHLGTLQLPRNPHLMLAAERGAMAPIAELTAADLAASSDGQGPQFEYSDWDTLAWLKAYAILADAGTSVPVQAIAPGTLPAQGTQVETANRLLALTQAEFNERIGNLYAYKQGRRDGRRVMRRGTLRLQHAGCVTDPAWLEPVTLTLDGDRNKRGYAFDGSRLVPTGMEMIFDHERGVIEEQLTVEEETCGSAGVTVIQAENKLADYSGDVYPESVPAEVTGMDVFNLNAGTKIIAVFLSDNTLRMTQNFTTPASAEGPNYTTIVDLATLGLSGTLRDFTVDAFSPLYLGSGSTVNGWVCTDVEVRRITDIFGTPALGPAFTFTYTSPHDNGGGVMVGNRNMNFERGIQNWGIVVSWCGHHGVYAARTTDGTSWTEVLVSSAYGQGGGSGYAWSHYWDFANYATPPNGWQVVQNEGAWVANQGFYDVYSSGFTRVKAGISANVTGAHVEAVYAQYERTAGSVFYSGEPTVYLGGVAIANGLANTDDSDPAPGGVRQFLKIGVDKTNTGVQMMYMDLPCGSVPSGGSMLLKKFAIAGSGVDPYSGAPGWLDLPSSFEEAPGLFISPHTAGKAYTSAFYQTGYIFNNTSGADGYKTGDYGVTWARMTDPDLDPGTVLACAIAVPYGSPAGSPVYFGWFNYTTSVQPRLKRAAGANVTDISPIIGELTFGPLPYNRAIAVSDGDVNTLVLCGQTLESAATRGVFLTRSASAAAPAWTTIYGPAASENYYTGAYVGGGSTEIVYLIGTNGAIAVYQGGVLDDRIGDLVSSGTIVGICGGG